MDAGEATSRVHTRGIDWIFQFSKGPKEPLERAFFFFFFFFLLQNVRVLPSINKIKSSCLLNQIKNL